MDRWTRFVLFVLLLIGAAFFLVKGTHSHWYAVETYGFDIWASERYPLGFYSRLVYEAVMYAGIVPWFATRLSASIILLIRGVDRVYVQRIWPYRRFTADYASGMSALGKQSLSHAAALLPFYLPVTAYYLSYPFTAQLIVGTVALAVISVGLFLGPLLSAHRAMQLAKERELHDFGALLNRHFDRVRQTLENSDDAEELLTVLDLEEKMRGTYDAIRELHTWPVDRALLVRLSGVLAPAGALLASQIASLLGF